MFLFRLCISHTIHFCRDEILEIVMSNFACDPIVQDDLGKYLNDILVQKPDYPRKWCCGTSRSLYCSECGSLLIEKEHWPTSIQLGQLQLPFDLDVILSDRRRSATGFHALVLIEASRNSNDRSEAIRGFIDPNDTNEVLRKNTFTTVDDHVRLFDIENGASLPSYEDNGEVFVLFPSKKIQTFVKCSDSSETPSCT